jgi:hypothetical protein
MTACLKELVANGTLLHNPVEDIIVLNPMWLAQVFATVITTKPSFIKNGILMHKDLPNIWKDYDESLYPYLIQILERFETLHVLDANRSKLDMNGKSMIPALLPRIEPVERMSWVFGKEADQTENRQLFERTWEFRLFPRNLLNRIIIRSIAYLAPTDVWLDGSFRAG